MSAMANAMSAMADASCSTTPDSVCSSLNLLSYDADVESGGEQSLPLKVVVKSTFIEVDEGPLLRTKAARLRKFKTDSLLQILKDGDSLLDAQEYQVGKKLDSDSGSESKAEEQSTDVSSDGNSEGILTPGIVSPKTQKEKQKPDNQSDYADVAQTTVMMRNIPNNYSRSMFLDLIDGAGFAGRYDFVYVPIDFGRCANLGYAFVNLVDVETTAEFRKFFDGYTQWEVPSAKVCAMGWSGHQGLKAHIMRYRNSPVMHPNVPDEYKPMIFQGSVRQEFPPPTKNLKPPHPNVRRR
eukprot:TRINITY_DN9289_c0_g1_i1.p1 TRINITY_DN9289_c0_g1~~TRINITY_DN9289_c0_g1_i1.p1  ORF type:complete len:295 (+),score=59.26 TRINITY_DN9289_c0_g1_i1:211-1095(+)